ncbi:hypothetical protein Ddc_18130 [Ditylenchus destructor]|nr:hypothetical protein Ddc_18130 [Ditylenchus destructor]
MSSLKDAGMTLDDEIGVEEDNFILAMVNCSTLSRVNGLYDSFNVCRPKGHNAVEERHFAYFIGGRFDPVFMDNFVRQTAHNIKIRIFTELSVECYDRRVCHSLAVQRPVTSTSVLTGWLAEWCAPARSSNSSTSNKSAVSKVDLIEEYKGNVRFGPLSTHKTGFADVKNIIDLREDITRLEIMKYDLTYTDVEPIIMSITTPVPVCQLLVVLRDKSAAQVARLIKSFNSALYYIYAANKSPHKRSVYYLSFMRFSCAPYYGTSNPFFAEISDVFDLELSIKLKPKTTRNRSFFSFLFG